MAEKDKMKAAAVKMYLDEHPTLTPCGPVDWEQIEFTVRFAEAARADAIEECATEACRGHGLFLSVNAKNEFIAAVRSLSRKQEDPR